MDIAIGSPATIPGVTRDQHLEWARRADAKGFSSLGVIDRIAYPNLEPLIALTAAAAVTERIRFFTAILLGPTRQTAVLAKQAASLDVLSNGRLTLGIAPGGRQDDFEHAGFDFSTRGKRFDQQLAELKGIWSDDEIVPRPVQDGGPPLMLGGTVEASYRRTAQWGDGWIAGGLPPDMVKEHIANVKQAWEAAGREGEPRIGALAYYALGDNAQEAAESYLKDYYGFLGDYADQIVGAAAKDADTIKQYVGGFEAIGVDELIFFPCDPDPDQVDRLAEAAL
jgi:alkanesulfonate monooxygenase SsuD/methylene tetrahydromethanopterin reductase-like flavin-dependent oxidoreductase (luciferase family)